MATASTMHTTLSAMNSQPMYGASSRWSWISGMWVPAATSNRKDAHHWAGDRVRLMVCSWWGPGAGSRSVLDIVPASRAAVT